MTRPRWTPEDDVLLVEKYREFGGNYNLIKDFFKERNTNSISKRYIKLSNLAKENDKPIKEFVESRREYSIIEEIQEILSHEKRNDRILRKIAKNAYSVTDVAVAILQLSNKNNLLLLKLIFVLKYLMIEWTNNIVDEIFKVSCEIRNDLFLQLCCFFQILDFTEIKQNIPFISECIQFLSYPHMVILSKEDYTRMARFEKLKKQKDLRINHLLSENYNLKTKINNLKEKIKK